MLGNRDLAFGVADRSRSGNRQRGLAGPGGGCGFGDRLLGVRIPVSYTHLDVYKRQLTANVTEQYDDKVEAGQVISASQEAGAQLKWGDSVDVVISKGPEMATIPSGLVGKPESAVTKTLEALGFEVKTDKVLGGLFGTVRTVKSGDTDLSNGGKIRLRDAKDVYKRQMPNSGGMSSEPT